METLGDIVARDRRSDDPAVVAPRERRRYDYHRFCTTAWKTGNFFRRIGVHDDAVVAVADDPEPEALLALFGAALLGAGTRFVPRSDADAADARVVVAPGESVGDYDLSAGGQRVCYGGPPDDPSVHHFERDVWSENPSFPRTAIDPESVALVAVGDGDERDSVRGNGDAPVSRTPTCSLRPAGWPTTGVSNPTTRWRFGPRSRPPAPSLRASSRPCSRARRSCSPTTRRPATSQSRRTTRPKQNRQSSAPPTFG
ncbi:hypothetical protein [Halorussus caseinilyticus]|uniref:AMP-dependent synthetase/ligase domain-containing protein n=1 Tax=Halorussus caseinilyticus TaxID=3034025 RepID=A0ABD5WPG8_9EURY